MTYKPTGRPRGRPRKRPIAESTPAGPDIVTAAGQTSTAEMADLDEWSKRKPAGPAEENITGSETSAATLVTGESAFVPDARRTSARPSEPDRLPAGVRQVRDELAACDGKLNEVLARIAELRRDAKDLRQSRNVALRDLLELLNGVGQGRLELGT